MTTHLSTSALVKAYLAGESASALARQNGVSVWSILSRLRKAGIQVRTSQQQNRRVLGQPQTDLFTYQEVLDGLLLGDGSLSAKADLRLSQSQEREGWVDQVATHLNLVGAETKKIRRTSRKRFIEGREVVEHPGVLIYTPSYQENHSQRQRWYPEGFKRVPRDINITPVVLNHWFCGDGTAGSKRQGSLSLMTNGFLEEDTRFLREVLRRDLGVESVMRKTPRGGQFTLGIHRRNEAMKLKTILEPWIPDCCRYKLRHIRPSKVRSPFTEEQVREIRIRKTNGERSQDLATEFGASETAIRRLVRGNTYRNVK